MFRDDEKIVLLELRLGMWTAIGVVSVLAAGSLLAAFWAFHHVTVVIR